MSSRPFRAADLASLAVDSMWEALFDLPSGDTLEQSVYVFFDVSQPPGREFAASALTHEEGLARESALAFVEATAAEAKARGDAVGVGAFFTIHDLVAVLARYVVDDASRTELTRLAAWLDKPIPLGTCRLVIVAGVELRASIARVARSGMHKTPAAALDMAMLN
jgi:hypothetical protein